MKNPNKPVPMTVWRRRVMIKGELCRNFKWNSRFVKASGGQGADVQRSG